MWQRLCEGGGFASFGPHGRFRQVINEGITQFYRGETYMNRMSKCASRMAVIALMWIPLHASAQLTLDNFTSGAYTKRTNNPQAHDTHYGALPANGLLGAARQTYFGAAPNPDGQWSTLDVGHGHFVIDSGFGSSASVSIGYGFTLAGVEVPLGLNLDGYSGFQ